MIFRGDKKFACYSCIRGHRASACTHEDRELREIRRKGRPVTQCSKCRELRKTRKAHVKCLCKEIKDNSLSIIPSLEDEAVERASPTKYRRLDDDGMGARRKVSSIDNLLNPCECSGLNTCKCCQPALTDFLHKSYPREVVEEAANAVRDHLKQTSQQQQQRHRQQLYKRKQGGSQSHGPSSIASSATDGSSSSGTLNGSSTASCPSGPRAPCCRTDDEQRTPASSQSTLPILRAAAVAIQQNNSAPRTAPLAAAHASDAAGRHVTLPKRNVHGLRLSQQPINRTYSQLPAIRNYKEATTTIPAVGRLMYDGKQHGHGTAHGGSGSGNNATSIMDRPKCGCGCDCDEKVALLVQKIEERLGLPVKSTGGIATTKIVGESPSEWVERILSPVVSAMHPESLPSLPSFPSLPSASMNNVSESAASTSSTVRLAPLGVPGYGGGRGEGGDAAPVVRKVSGTYSEPHSGRSVSFSPDGSDNNSSSHGSSHGSIASSPSAGNNRRRRGTLSDVVLASQIQDSSRGFRTSGPWDTRTGFSAGVVPPLVPPISTARNSGSAGGSGSGGGCCSSSRKQPTPAGSDASSSGSQSPEGKTLPPPSSCCSGRQALLPQQVLPLRSCCDPRPSLPRLDEAPQAVVLRRAASGQPAQQSPATSAEAAAAAAAPSASRAPVARVASLQSLTTPTAESSGSAKGKGKREGGGGGCSSCGNKCSCCKNNSRRWQPSIQESPLVDEDGALACSCGCHKPFQECSDCVADLCEGLLLKEAKL
ncbi:copper-binding transcription factor [Coemansia sp. BCRC 34490]|nr:copper-binding transcription factor [Coemansia sp. BCRC 34490]